MDAVLERAPGQENGGADMNDLLKTAYDYVETVRYKSEMANGSRVWHDWALKEAFIDGYLLAETHEEFFRLEIAQRDRRIADLERYRCAGKQ
jgi:hypothetical protein